MTEDQILTRSVARFSTPLARQLMQLALHPGGARALVSAFPMFGREPLLTVLVGRSEPLAAGSVESLAEAVRGLELRESLGSPGTPELSRGAPGDLQALVSEWVAATFGAPPVVDEPGRRVRRIDSADLELSTGAPGIWPAWVELETRVEGRDEHFEDLRFAFRRPGFAAPDAVADAERHGERWWTPAEAVTAASSAPERIRALLIARCLLTVRLQLDAHLPGHYVGAHLSAALARAPVAARSALGRAALTYALDADASTQLGAHVIVGAQGVFRETPIREEGLRRAVRSGVEARAAERLLGEPLPDPLGRTLGAVRSANQGVIAAALPEILEGTTREALEVYALTVNQASEWAPEGFFGELRTSDDVAEHLEVLSAHGCLGHTAAHALQDLLGAPDYGPLALRPGAELPLPSDAGPEALEAWLKDALPRPSDGALVQLVTGEMLAAPNAHEVGRVKLERTNPLRALPSRISLELEGLETRESGVTRVSLSAAV